MKGHDALCPTGFPHLKDRAHCAYCNLIETVRADYKARHPKNGGKAFDEGFAQGYAAAIHKLQEAL